MEKKFKCPHCKKQFKREETDSWPFCSERCQLVDLNSWLNEGYRIPTAENLDKALEADEGEDY